MSCPYLKKTEAYYCEAFPKKVLIHGVSAGGEACQSHRDYRSCSIYKEHEGKKNKNIEMSKREDE